MTTSTKPPAATSRPAGPDSARRGRRHAAITTAAEAIRSHATPRGSTRANSSTANEGPR
jgi:hypothetical protein